MSCKLLEKQWNRACSAAYKNNSRYKLSYYYFSVSNKSLAKVKNLIRTKAHQMHLGTNISACNPLNGDPPNSYDVDFIPINSGKSNVVKRLLQKYDICRENSYAFGDSENDIKMLKTVKMVI
jgi:kanosamine-6-phosphate phosphatase